MNRRSTCATVLLAGLLAVSGCGDSERASIDAGTGSGSEFADPGGAYTIMVDPTWPSSVLEDKHGWIVGPDEEGFAANLVVSVERTGSPDVASFIAQSVREMGSRIGYIESELVEGDDGDERGVIEYSGPFEDGERKLHPLSYMDLVGDQVVVATLGVREESFDEIRVLIEPYMRTLTAR